MSFWNGTRWVPDASGPSTSPPRGGRRLIAAAAEAALITALIFGLIASGALAAKGGNGKGNGSQANRTASACVVDGNVVTGSELPTDEVVNFMVTDQAGTWGWVVGYSDTGVLSVSVPPRDGPTTYEFASRTYGPEGSKYETFAACSA